MTREDIIRMARQAEDYADTIYEKGEYHPGWLEVRDTHFAKLVAEAEQEACAEIAEAWDADHTDTNYGLCIGNAIRARGSK